MKIFWLLHSNCQLKKSDQKYSQRGWLRLKQFGIRTIVSRKIGKKRPNHSQGNFGKANPLVYVIREIQFTNLQICVI